MAECKCTEIANVKKVKARICEAKNEFLNGPTQGRFAVLETDIRTLYVGCSEAFESVNEVSLKGYINGLDKQLEVVKNNVISKIDSRINELNNKLEVLDREDKEYHEQEVNDSMESEE